MKTSGIKVFNCISKTQRKWWKVDLFSTGIQTKEQHEMFVKHSSNITFRDVTHGTNQYGFSLISLVAPDYFGKG